MIPHITNEIKECILGIAKDVDVVIVEIGGTVGDIESQPFLEAIRQFRQDVGRENTLYVHLTLVPFIGTAGELKTKPTQHSVRDLRSIGIQPDILLCRTDRYLPRGHQAEDRALLRRRRGGRHHGQGRRRRSTRCRSCLADEGLDDIILKYLHLPQTEPHMEAWEDAGRAASSTPSDEITIHVVGKYVELDGLVQEPERGAVPRRLRQPRCGSTSTGSRPRRSSRTAASACSTAPTASWCRAGSALRGTRGMMRAARDRPRAHASRSSASATASSGRPWTSPATSAASKAPTRPSATSRRRTR